MTTTATFLTAFKPDKREHVEWFSDMIKMAENMSIAENGFSMVAEVNKNPMGVKLEDKDALEWCHIHFCIGMKYAKAVVQKTAYIPQ